MSVIRQRGHLVGGLVLLLVFALGVIAPGQQDGKDIEAILQSDDPTDLEALADLSLEELLGLEVTSIARRRQRATDTPAAIYVLTRDEILRSGARSLPEALRLVPGVEVAQVNRHRWAVSIRGYNDVISGKLLVLIDGRSVYSPIFTGTFWNQQDVPIEAIERIEVLRGPGGTLWGANAVNGVINVVTATAKKSQGGQFKTVAGDSELESYLRYGFAVGDDVFVRLHGRWFHRDGFTTGGGDENDWSAFQGGLRLDWDVDRDDTLSFQINGHDGVAEQEIDLVLPTPPTFRRLVKDEIRFSGTNLLVDWQHDVDGEQDIHLKVYHDYQKRDEQAFEDVRHTLDLDFQHRFAIGEAQEVIWGLGYRFIAQRFRGGYQIDLDPADRDQQIFSFFVQDEIELVEDVFRVLVGTKLEHNDFSGFEVQPSLRLVWKAGAHDTVWAAISRAVQTPAPADHDLRLRQPPQDLGGGLVAAPELRGKRGLEATDLLAFELGWRSRPLANLSLDLALFYNDYEHVRTQEPGAPFLDPAGYAVLPFVFDDNAKAEIYGFELLLDWQALDELRLTASWSFLDIRQHAVGSLDPQAEADERHSPHHRLVFRAAWRPLPELDLDATFHWTDELEGDGIPGYARLDLQVRWRPREDLEVGAGVRNLLEDRHPEFLGSFGRTPAEVERTFYLFLDFRF